MFVVLALGAPSLGAQGLRVSGRVRHVAGSDTSGLAGSAALLHEVTRSGGGKPIDSTRTDRDGAYRFSINVLDTTAVYFISVSYAGINYVSRPVPATARELRSETLYVYDTSSVAPVLEVAQRHLIIRAPARDGSRRVLELVVVRNPGTVTRVAADTTRPVWGTLLPEGAADFEVGESDVGAQTIARRGDSLALYAPVPPGEKQLIVAYLLPESSRELRLPVDQPVARLNVLVEDSLSTLEAGLLKGMPPEEMEGVRFARFEGMDVREGPVVIRFGRRPFAARRLWWLVIAIAGLVLTSALTVWLRRAAPVPVASNVSADVLAARIAALDAAHEQRQGGGQPAEVLAYQRAREALKSQLVEVLAKTQRL